MTDDASVVVVFKPESEVYSAGDARWLAQVNELCADVQRQTGGLRKEVTPVAGHKGGAEALILALGSAGAIKAAAEVFKAWLARDRTRGLTLTVKNGAETREIAVNGTGMSADDITKFMERALTLPPQ